jgi:hypothetical protein
MMKKEKYRFKILNINYSKENQEILMKIIFKISEIGYISNVQEFGSIFFSQYKTPKQRINWDGNVSSLVCLFLLLIHYKIIDSEEYNFIEMKLSNNFNCFSNKKKEFVTPSRSTINESKNRHRDNLDKKYGSEDSIDIKSIVLQIFREKL